MEEGRPVMRFLVYLEILCLLESQGLFVFGTFFVFSKAQCCASTNLLCGYVQTSSFAVLLAFSFSLSLSLSRER